MVRFRSTATESSRLPKSRCFIQPRIGSRLVSSRPSLDCLVVCAQSFLSSLGIPTSPALPSIRQSTDTIDQSVSLSPSTPTPFSIHHHLDVASSTALYCTALRPTHAQARCRIRNPQPSRPSQRPVYHRHSCLRFSRKTPDTAL
ncbi:hypothetical protein LY76DRAFT_357365 [Colletotrichum caudatum]|nr:hypothetical protein LY76DRAFT_357365 [Colletotrichum caudatum]